MHKSLEELILTCLLFLSLTFLQYHLFPSASKQKVNAELLRKSVKAKWLDYYQENHLWLNNIKVWVTYKGQRRPTSSFILGVITTLEPELTQMLPLLVDLNSDPDQIVESLGLNFNPKEELEAILQQEKLESEEEVKMLPAGTTPPIENINISSRLAAKADASCKGVYKKKKLKKLPFEP